ncbi:MAG TPA: arabinofuranosidase catalytic domain-containing protein [Bacteroidales bacterium]|nr:arabinofuranosidase catalytic domain-containing protein [Bacteroidales bacterium]
MKKENKFIVFVMLAITLPVIIIAGIAFTGCTSQRPEGPCDIYTAAGYPCVTAHSTTRALYSKYNGPLYQIMRESDGKTLDIGNNGGYADAAAHDAFCENTICWITTVYDQTGNNNNLVQAPPGTFRGPAKGGFNTLPLADLAPVSVSGHKAYGVYIMPGAGLRNNNAKGLAVNDEPQGIYMVFDGTHFDHGCCFNYGNTSTNSRAVGRGTMETVYFGTATAWGRGNGDGPWIMSDMEAGLFSGYDPKQNIADPEIDSWRFVTGMVKGGGGNQWAIYGGNAQGGDLDNFYEGVRPQSNENDWYYPMHRKGAVQLGNGGDNGNGSSGTFYEGVMITGYPDVETMKAIQANIVAAKYNSYGIELSRLTTFTPGSSQDAVVTFTNRSEKELSDVTLSVSVPEGWTASETGSGTSSVTITGSIAPGELIRTTFKLTSPDFTGSGYLSATASWSGKSESISGRIRNVMPVKINEVRLAGSNTSDQFIELYNPGDSDIDISNWSLINTKSEWAPVKLLSIPEGTKIAPKGFYLLGLSGSGLAASAAKGNDNINVLSVTDMKPGQAIEIGGETRIISKIGTAASPMTLIFIPVSTGPWITIPAGSTNLPVTNISGFEAGQKIGIDLGGKYEEAIVTNVGKASTLTNLAVEAKEGDTVIRVVANENMSVGDTLTIGTGAFEEQTCIKNIISVVSSASRAFDPVGGPVADKGGAVEIMAPLKYSHKVDEDISDRGTGISFTPATKFVHKSGDAVQALGSGLILDKALDSDHPYGTAILNQQAKSIGYQGSTKPDLWYGAPLSASAGSVTLIDNSGLVIVDAIVYGSLLGNSSAAGTITSPEIAILEGDQGQAGCIVVVPGTGRSMGPMALANNIVNRSIGRYPDGNDNDSNCSDFLIQPNTTLALTAERGSNKINATSVTGLTQGQKIILGSGPDAETALIAEVGTSGGTLTGAPVTGGATMLLVRGTEGFSAGQTITIDSKNRTETAVISSVANARRRFMGGNNNIPLDTIKLSTPLKSGYIAGSKVAGSGITLKEALKKTHNSGTQMAGGVPTPGAPNEYSR